MRIAIIHYWLVAWRGGEKVLKAISEAYPQADIYTHVYDLELIAQELPGKRVTTTFIAKLPFALSQYQRYLPLMPIALEQLDLQNYDLVISNESGPAKGVVVAPHAKHLCYCNSPMRYLWDMYPEYLSGAGAFTKFFMRSALHYMRMWDQLSAQRVDKYIANSHFISARISKYYRRSSQVIYPPVDIESFYVSDTHSDFYLSVGQLVAYKRADLLVEAFNELGLPLVIIGEGVLFRQLKKVAKPNVTLLGRQPFDVIRKHYARCQALVFPGVEDFGIVPVEAMASGRPVIAFAAGGALDTVIDPTTGILFRDQSVAGLVNAVRDFENTKRNFDPLAIRAHAEQFSTQRFTSEFKAAVEDLMSGR